MPQVAQELGPILTAHLFRGVERRLIELLRSLAPGDWDIQTIAPMWTVKAVAAHLLDTQLRKLSTARDKYLSEAFSFNPENGDLVSFINRLNQEGVALYSRLSPPLLTSLMDVASREYSEFHESLDPFKPARIGVSWAGEKSSLNWFDTARELTERWHHQQQIRLAVNRPGIMTREFYHPVLDCFMRALPYAYRDKYAAPGTLLQYDVQGECGGTWWLLREAGHWRLMNGPIGSASVRVTIPEEIAWRIFTKGIDRASAVSQTKVSGDLDLGLHILNTIAIVG